ncbi:hypothetical protein EL22_20435 [Halostagnicola sp. A56]|nr:hypothetical protein EL22_20435 [Halostagnicola sp. A56]
MTVAYLPDAEALSLDGTPPSELNADWDAVLNNGQYRLEFRDDDPDGDHPPYQAEATVAHDGTLTHTIEDVLDGEQFSVRIRTETDYATGGWLSAEEITKLYSPDVPTFTAVGETDLGLDWTNNSVFDGSNQVYRRRIYADDVGQWRLVGSVADDGTTFTDTSTRPDTTYEYRITALTQWISSDSAVSTPTTTDGIGLEHRSVPPRGWHAEIERPNGTIVTPAILSDGTQFQPTLNGQPTATIDISRDEAYLLERFEGADMRVYRNGKRKAIDELEDIAIETDRDELIGYGGTELEQDVSVGVDDQHVSAFVRDLLEEHAPEYVLNIDEFDSTVDEDVIVGDAADELEFEQFFEAIASDETLPVEYADGELKPLHTAVMYNLGGDLTDDRYIGGEAAEPFFSESISFDHIIPEEHVGLAVREGIMGGDVGDVTYSFDGTETVTAYDPSDRDDPGWFDVSVFYDGGDLTDSATFFGAQDDSGAHDDDLVIDAICVYDARYHDSDEWDETLHEPGGYPEKPTAYPNTPLELTVETIPQFQRAVAATLSVQGSFDGGIRGMSLSADNGQTWYDADDTDEFTTEFDEPGPYLRARIELEGWEPDGPRDDFPRTGYAPETISSIEFAADLDDTPLVLNYEEEGELGEILAARAEQAEAVYEVWQDGEDTVFEWTWPGQRPATRSDAISDYSVTKHTRRTLRCKVKGNNATVRAEEIAVDELDAVYPLEEDDVVRGQETVRDSDGERLRVGLDYELHGAAGEVEILSQGSVGAGETIEVDYKYTISGTYEHPDYDGDTRQARTEKIPAARSERACEQAAKVIVDEASVPRWEADVTIAYEDVQDIRLSDTLDIDTVPGDAEVVRELGDQGSDSGVSLRLGNRKPASERVSQIQSTLSSASDLV